MASIQPRQSATGARTWRVMYRVDGRQVSDGFTDERAALAHKRLVETIGGQAARDSLDAHTLAPGSATLGDYFAHYLEHLTGAQLGTVAEYRRLAARTWLPHLGHLPLDAISVDAVRKWVGWQAQQLTIRGTPTKAKTIANAHGLLSQTFAAAVDAEVCTRNPAHKVALPSGMREEMVILTDGEFARLLHEVPAYWRPLIVTLISTGMRWGEATALRWVDVDLDADVPRLTVTRAWKRGEAGARVLGAPKTKRSRRSIDLTPEAVDELRPLRDGAKPDDLVFRGPRGGSVHHQAFYPRVWQPAVDRANLGKRPRIHDLRHTCASWLLAGGAQVIEVQRQLGHESAKTTLDVYGHFVPGSGARVVGILSRALSSAMPAIESAPGDGLAVTGQ